jgi:hypothetical protein
MWRFNPTKLNPVNLYPSFWWNLGKQMHRQTFEHIWLPILFSQNLSPSCLTILGIVPCQFYSLDFQDKIEKIGNIPPKLYSSLSGMYSSRRTVIIAQPKIFIVTNQRTNLVPQSPVLMTLQSRQVLGHSSEWAFFSLLENYRQCLDMMSVSQLRFLNLPFLGVLFGVWMLTFIKFL